MIENKRAKTWHWLKSLALTASLVLGAAGAGQADQTNIEITATAPDGCDIDPALLGTISVTLNPFAVADDGTIADSNTNVDLGNMSCNVPHTISLQTLNGGLVRTGGSVAVPDGFTAIIPYTAEAPWGGSTIVLAADNNPLAIASGFFNTPTLSGLFVNVKTVKNQNKKLLGGTYKDTLTVKIISSL